MMKTFLICVSFLLCQLVFAQKYTNTWTFGKSATVDFNSGTPVVSNNSNINTPAGVACISDPVTGDLLFFTNGEKVFGPDGNAYRDVIGDKSGIQNSIIIPTPDPMQYIFFTTTPGSAMEGLREYRLDMMLRPTPIGEVAGGSLHMSNITGNITACKHANGKDYWVIVHGNGDNKFYAYLIDSPRSTLVPVISEIGRVYHAGATGQLKVSPDGSLIAFADTNGLELLDFDIATGVVSNNEIGGNSMVDWSEKVHGVSFSPNSKKLYASIDRSFNGGGFVFQYDVSKRNALEIINSEYRVTSSPRSELPTLQLAADGKIYAKYDLSRLSVIAAPDSAKEKVSFEETALNLGTGAVLDALPNFVESFFGSGSNCQANFEFSVSLTDKSEPGDTIDFTDKSTGNIHVWAWDLGAAMSYSEQNPTITIPPGNHKVCLTVNDTVDGCQSVFCDTIIVGKQSDLVWPGDADNNGIANINDILPLGIAYGSQGITRDLPSSDWKGQFASDWSNTFPSGINYKHADCDGDGKTDIQLDAEVILRNYGRTHSKNEGDLATGQAGPELQFRLPNDSVATGDSLKVPIELGTSTNPVADFYGMVFTVNYDPSLVDSASIEVNFKNNWLGQFDQEHYGIYKNFYGSGQIDIGITRINQQNVSGFGQIAELSYVMQDDLIGKQKGESKVMALSFSNVKMISLDETELKVSAVHDSVTVYESETGIALFNNPNSILTYPNPARYSLTVVLDNHIANKVSLYTVTGVMAREISGRLTGTQQLDINGLPAGLYILTIETNGTAINKRITISH